MTHDPRGMADAFLGISPQHVQHMRILASRADPRTAARPPWSWANLTDDEAGWLDSAIAVFVVVYNEIHACQVDHVIPPCWREHPALAQELPVQLWGWWAANLDEQSTILTVLEFFDRHLPAFQDRLGKGLLGRGAVDCRKGRHAGRQIQLSQTG